MDMQKLKTVLSVGETVAVEFKRCGGKAEADACETVCSFLNRFGGDIYLGVEDDGTVAGVPEKSASDIIKNFISMVSNPDAINPTVYLAPEIIEHEGKKIVRVHVPPSSEVHSLARLPTLRKVNIDRYDDRLIAETNLIDSYDLLMGFAGKHLLDKFYLSNVTQNS
jgi:ATP-dependent DNA helicase RecG